MTCRAFLAARAQWELGPGVQHACWQQKDTYPRRRGLLRHFHVATLAVWFLLFPASSCRKTLSHTQQGPMSEGDQEIKGDKCLAKCCKHEPVHFHCRVNWGWVQTVSAIPVTRRQVVDSIPKSQLLLKDNAKLQIHTTACNDNPSVRTCKISYNLTVHPHFIPLYDIWWLLHGELQASAGNIWKLSTTPDTWY